MRYLLVSLIVYLILESLGCKSNPVIPPNNDNDTTSHSLSWQIDSLGIYPSELRDIWGSDINNIYAVGFIQFSYSPYKYSAIVHWDGSKWNSLDYLEGYLNGIYGFEANDIWAVGYWQKDNNSYQLITHWDGNNWTTLKNPQYGGLVSIWGTSSSNLYAVGWDENGGLILHFDGRNWNKQPSGTMFGLADVSGIDKTHIFSCGYQSSSGTGILLEFNGNLWQTVTTGGIINDSNLYGEFSSIWGASLNRLYLIGSLSYEGTPGTWKLSDIPYNSPEENIIGLASMNKVRGNGINNVFICGDRDLIIHWNGKSWFVYNQFFDKTKQSSLKGIWAKNKNVFIVGYENNLSQAMVYRGTQ